MRLYITRHGESEANALKIISNRDLPHALTDTGRIQTASLAEKLRGKPISRIYTSPILRAKQTAEILSLSLGVPMECVDALREPDCGVLEGRGDAEAWVEHNFWKEEWFHGRALNRGPHGGETCKEVCKRLGKFVKNLVTYYRDTESELLLVTHGALILYGLPGLLAGVSHQFILEHGIGNTVLITSVLQDGKLACLNWESD